MAAVVPSCLCINEQSRVLCKKKDFLSFTGSNYDSDSNVTACYIEGRNFVFALLHFQMLLDT